jgi:hypothetical protein
MVVLLLKNHQITELSSLFVLATPPLVGGVVGPAKSNGYATRALGNAALLK